MLSSLVVILLIISCSISLMVQCFKRKQTKKDSSPAAKKQELKRKSSKGHDALAAKQGKLDNKKPPARDVRRKTDTPKVIFAYLILIILFRKIKSRIHHQFRRTKSTFSSSLFQLQPTCFHHAASGKGRSRIRK